MSDDSRRSLLCTRSRISRMISTCPAVFGSGLWADGETPGAPFSLVFREMWDTTALYPRPLIQPQSRTNRTGAPMFASAYMGQKRNPSNAFTTCATTRKASLLRTRSRTSRMILMCQSSRGFDLQLRARMVALLFQQSPQLRMDTEGGRIRRLIRRIEIQP
jgi:hypothetical protein